MNLTNPKITKLSLGANDLQGEVVQRMVGKNYITTKRRLSRRNSKDGEEFIYSWETEFEREKTFGEIRFSNRAEALNFWHTA